MHGQYCGEWTSNYGEPAYQKIIYTNATLFGSEAIMTCNMGYYVVNKTYARTESAICTENGTWSIKTYSDCMPSDCGRLPTPQNGYVLATATTYRSTASITCHTGYILHGDRTSICGANGLWSSTGQTCFPVYCGPFRPPMNSHLSSGTTTYNSTVIITCFPGYILSGNRTSTCGANGHWSNADQECVLQTVFLRVPEASCTFADNDTCICENISLVQSLAGDSCTAMRWQNTSVQNNTRFTMTSPILQPGMYQISLQQIFPFLQLRVTMETDNNVTNDLTSFWKFIKRDTMWMNETVMLIAEKEFRIVFRANETKDGLLGFENIKILKACDLLNITNGHIIVNHNTAYFRCDEGFRIVGNSSATCKEWTWSSDAPNCERIDCGTPMVPLNGHMNASSTLYGSVSTISCIYGYFMKGVYMGVCENNEKWTNENTTCLSINDTMISAVIPGCSNHGWNIAFNLTLLRHFFSNYNDEIQMHLGIESCKGTERHGFLVYDNNFSQCMTRRKVSANLNILENTMALRFNPQYSAASKSFNWTMNVHCNVVDNNIITTISTNHLQNNENNINISVFSDPFFRNAFPINHIHVHTGDPVYVKISSPVHYPEIKLLLKSCYVRPAHEQDSRLDSVVIHDGCEVESTTHMISVAAHEILFMFQNYLSVALLEGIHVFCDVAYCNSHELSVDCTQTCKRMLGPVIIG